MLQDIDYWIDDYGLKIIMTRFSPQTRARPRLGTLIHTIEVCRRRRRPPNPNGWTAPKR